jgi:hypothetical protein
MAPYEIRDVERLSDTEARAYVVVRGTPFVVACGYSPLRSDAGSIRTGSIDIVAGDSAAIGAWQASNLDMDLWDDVHRATLLPGGGRH